jgi:hypothetical protein
MTTINPASTTAAGIVPAQTDPSLHTASNLESETPQLQDSHGDHPLAKFALNDLHQAVQRFAGFARDPGQHADPWLAPHAPQAETHPGKGMPLYNGQTPNGAPVQQTPAPPAIPGAPIDVRQMEAWNAAVQKFKVDQSPLPQGHLRHTQHVFQSATDALKAGDFKKAQQELAKLGFPLPPMHSKPTLSTQQLVTAHLLGVSATGTGNGGWQLGEVRWGGRGNQAINDLNGFAANAIMINRMASAPGGVDNPPSEAQATQYMREFAQPGKGKVPSAQEVMQAASEITNGTIVHYSSAGKTDPIYNKNPNPHAFYKGRDGMIHEFASAADAQKAADAGNPPKGRNQRITVIESRSPDQWSDITSQGTRAGRHVGDCESKVYLQTRLLTEAGFTSLGSVDVHPKGGGTGHMLGVFKAPDGSVWITSNEEFRQVKPGDAKLGVTQADLDSALKEFTAQVYHIEPNYKGELDLSDYTFSAAATANLQSGNAAIDSIRRCTEMLVLGKSDTLIPTPIKP